MRARARLESWAKAGQGTRAVGWRVAALAMVALGGALLASRTAAGPAGRGASQAAPAGGEPAALETPGDEGAALQLVPAAATASRTIGVVGAPGVAELLQKAGYEARAVAPQEVDGGMLDSYGLLLVNLERPLSVTGAAFLRDFATRGGAIIACSWGAAVAPRRQSAFPVYRLQDVLQIRVLGWSADGNAYLRAPASGPLLRGLPEFIDVRHRATPLIEPAPGARVEMFWVADERAGARRGETRSPAVLLSPRTVYFAPNVLAEALESRQMLRLLVNAIGALLPGAVPDPSRLALAELDVALAEARRAAANLGDPGTAALLAAIEARAAAAIQLAAQAPQPAPAIPVPAGAPAANGGPPPVNGSAPKPAAGAGGSAAPIRTDLASRGTGDPARAGNGAPTVGQASGEAIARPAATGPPGLPAATLTQITDAIDAAERLALLEVPCRTTEARAVLLPRSQIPTTRPAITQLMDRLRTAGINLVMPEAYSAGIMLVPGPGQDPRFAGQNPLAAIIAEAGARGMAVHAWISVLSAGPAGARTGVLATRPGWAAQTRKGGRYVAAGQQWLCPAQVEVRDAVCADIRRAVANQPVQGIVLDGLDYGGLPEACYDRTCTALFHADTGHNPRTETLRPEWEQEWLRWRRDRVSSLVRRIVRELREARPGITVHVAVAAPSVDPRVRSLADWRAWTQAGWADGVCPVLEGGDAITARKLVRWVQRLAPGARVLPVAPTARIRTSRQAMRLVVGSQEANAAGLIFDAARPVADRWALTLSRGAYRQPAQLPW